jgi:radical SAM protein with 4Fe4S-binding SPASM domain
MTCAPHYKRIQLEARRNGDRNGAPPHASGRGCMAGVGFCFVSHLGEVGGCGYLPLRAGSVRDGSLVEIYRTSTLFESIRDTALLQGRCGRCEYRALCGGCRARALSATGNYLDEEPFCTYQPRGARAPVDVEALVRQAIPHEARGDDPPPRDLIPPVRP